MNVALRGPPERRDPRTASLWPSLVEARSQRLAAEGRWRGPGHLRRTGPRGRARRGRRKVVAFASNDYLGLSLHPTVVAAAHEALDHWGTRGGRQSASDRVAARCTRSSSRRWRSGSSPSAPRCSPLASRPTSGCSTRSATAACASAPTSSTTRRSSTGPACRTPRWPSTATATSEHLEHLLRAATGPAHRGHRGGLLHGRRHRPGPRHRGGVPTSRGAAGARRGPRRASAPTSAPTSPTSTSCGWARCRRPSGLWADSWPAGLDLAELGPEEPRPRCRPREGRDQVRFPCPRDRQKDPHLT